MSEEMEIAKRSQPVRPAKLSLISELSSLASLKVRVVFNNLEVVLDLAGDMHPGLTGHELKKRLVSFIIDLWDELDNQSRTDLDGGHTMQGNYS